MVSDTVAAHTTPPMCHSSTLAQLPDGRLVCAWYAGSYECAPDTVLQWTVQNAQGGWGPIRSLDPFPGCAVGNPVLDWNPATEVLTMYFSVVAGSWWTAAILVSMTSKDLGQTWAPPYLLTPEPGIMARTNAVHLRNGALLLPIYREHQRVPLVLLSTDQGSTWQMTGDTTIAGSAIQPAVVELPNETLAMFTRTSRGSVFVSYSFNHGQSWTMSQSTTLPNPNSSIATICTQEGQVLIVLNPSDHSRETLAYGLSPDGGETWSGLETIAHRPHAEYSYPSLWQDSKNNVHLVFTENRMTIQHRVLTITR